MPREVEIKFLVEDAVALARKLRSCGFRLVTRRTHEVNTLYDLPGRPLRRRGEILRLRKYGDSWTLTHKSKGEARRHKLREETETGVADGPSLDRILRALGFSPTFRYEKFRSEWTDGGGHLVVDETPIGIVAEIEGRPRWIDGTARLLGIPRSNYITSSYAAMFDEWKRNAGSRAQEMTFAAIGRRKRNLSIRRRVS
ncbi:MAG TPA: class IV adenylate cyclase [Terriglobales bacterium]|jgi:adenylate cyclase class 2|nr:class IV adenylate cyclase [Terriglobales bacterium]